MKFVFIALLAALPAFSQLVSVGVKAGVPFTDAYSVQSVADGVSSFTQDRYTVGPTIEFHLPFHLSFEVDALYRHSDSYINAGSGTGSASVKEWQIPLLAKYEIPFGPVRPFVDGGLAYRHLSVDFSNPDIRSSLDAQNPDNAGFTFGGGIGLKLSRFRISPEIRYTHWGQTAFSISGVTSNNNQADFLVGFTF